MGGGLVAVVEFMGKRTAVTAVVMGLAVDLVAEG